MTIRSPTGVKKLVGEDMYRVRAGDYRIVYQMRGKKLTGFGAAIAVFNGRPGATALLAMKLEREKRANGYPLHSEVGFIRA